MKLIVDLDDALINSSRLNNDAYNYALEKFGYNRKLTNDRLTRANLNEIDESLLTQIIKLKQEYFISDWLPYRIVKNEYLINKLNKFRKNNCFLWTKADKNRVESVLQKCKIKNLFNQIIFDNKNSFEQSISKLKEITKFSEFIIYENNHLFFANQDVKIIDEIKNKNFEVKGYLIR